METPTFPPDPAAPGGDPPPLEAFAALIDAVRMYEGFARWATACRAEAIDQARLWTEATDLSVPTTGGPRWTPKVAGHRVLVTELACA
jgi:hypothetical protein